VWGSAPKSFRARYNTIAPTSMVPSTIQQIALRRSPANQYPVAALKQRIALVHPLPHAAGLLSIFRSFIKNIVPKVLSQRRADSFFLRWAVRKIRTAEGGCPHMSSNDLRVHRLFFGSGIAIRLRYQIGRDKDCEAGETAPEVDEGMEPGLEESDCYED